MKNHYYIDQNGNVQGPVTPEQLQQLHRSGQISAATQVCPEGSENWLPYYKAPEAQIAQKQQQKLPEQKKEPIATNPPELASTTSPASIPMTKTQGNIIVYLLLIGIGAPFFSMVKPIPKWEFMIVAPSDSLFESSMNRYGEQGWELVSARRATGGGGASYECIMKRPLR